MRKIIIGVIAAIGIFATVSAYAYMSSYSNADNMMTYNTMSSMMNQIPQDVIIKIISGQMTEAGKESKIILLVLDKTTNEPLSDAQVIVGIEKGSSMSTMMMDGMMEAKSQGSGKYSVQFTPDTSDYYTLHTHVIPDGKSMHSMMENHLDIGIIVN